MGATTPVELINMIFDKKIIGTSLGNMRPSIDIPRYIDLYMRGEIPLDELVTKTYRLDQINEAIEAVLKGEILRSVIIHK